MNTKEFIMERSDRIDTNLKIFHETRKPEALHRFRVELKKLKALYLLIGSCDERFDTRKEFKIHRKMFRQSGRIRNYNVMADLMKKYRIDQAILTSLPDIKNPQPETDRFCAGIRPYLSSLPSEKKKLHDCIKDIHKKDVRAYLEENKKKIKKLLKPRSYETSLHAVRKKCKNIIYLSGLDKNYSPGELLIFDNLQDAIGTWHDLQVLSEALSQASSNQNTTMLRKLNTKRGNIMITIEHLRAKLFAI